MVYRQKVFLTSPCRQYLFAFKNPCARSSAACVPLPMRQAYESKINFLSMSSRSRRESMMHHASRNGATEISRFSGPYLKDAVMPVLIPPGLKVCLKPVYLLFNIQAPKSNIVPEPFTKGSAVGGQVKFLLRDNSFKQTNVCFGP